LRIGQKIWGRTLFPYFTRGIAVSEPAARYASSAWKRSLEIIPNGVATETFVPGFDRAFGHGVDRAAGDPLRVLFVGKLGDERKGFRYLLDAHRRLLSRGVRVHLDVVGEGSEVYSRDEHVTFHGALPLVDLVRRLQTCDLFVAPSTSQESFGIVLLEAMATAAPIVCSDIDGYRRVVHPHGASLVAPRDPIALAAAIRSLVDAPATRRAMGAINRRHALEYDWSVVAPRVREVYLSAIEEAAPLATPSIAPVTPVTPEAIGSEAAE
jgi:phosphatidylinositol alpha-mannosyltransferase